MGTVERYLVATTEDKGIEVGGMGLKDQRSKGRSLLFGLLVDEIPGGVHVSLCVAVRLLVVDELQNYRLRLR